MVSLSPRPGGRERGPKQQLQIQKSLITEDLWALGPTSASERAPPPPAPCAVTHKARGSGAPASFTLGLPVSGTAGPHTCSGECFVPVLTSILKNI